MAKALVLFQLSVLLLSSFTVLSHGEWYSLHKNVDHLSPAQAPKPHKGHHHHPKNSPAPSPIYSPTKSPAKSPTPPPAKPPTPPAYSPSKQPVKPPAPSKAPAKPPVKPPTPSPSPYYPSRKSVAVRGLVYCKPCKFRGVETLNQEKPLQGAVVELVCKNTEKALVEQGTTDKNGFFWITPKLMTSGAYHKCKVFLVSSNASYCDVPTNYNGGKSGALLKYTPLPKPPPPATIKFDVFTVGPFGFEPSKKVPCKK
ncbi:unnamed protein product [Withania somnifera]